MNKVYNMKTKLKKNRNYKNNNLNVYKKRDSSYGTGVDRVGQTVRAGG